MREPVAVRMIDIDAPRDLALAAEGERYRTLLVIATSNRCPVGAVTLSVENLDAVPAERLRALIEEQGWTRRASPAPVAPIPEVSVVVSTCAQPASVIVTVASVLACDPPPVEVIVVENRPHASPVRAALAERFGEDPRVRFVEEHRVGLASARNAGLRIARGQVVAFTDDDVRVDPGWVGAIACAFAAEPSAACVTGLILPCDLLTREQVLLEQFAGFGKGYERRVSRLSEPTSPLFPFAARQFGSGANTALRTDVTRSVGGFDTALGSGTVARGAEDLDMYIRILLCGHALVYEPAAIVWHEHPDSLQGLRRRLFNYGVSLSAMLMKYGLSRYGLTLLRRGPAAAAYLRDSNSLKNRRKGVDYLRSFDWTERAGMAFGPIAYLVSRRRQRRAGVATVLTVGHEPAWVGELELGEPQAVLRPPPLCDDIAYDRARLLVRDGETPVGFAEVRLSDGAAGAEIVRAEVERQVEMVASAEPACTDSGGQALTVSVIVCTRERPKSLRTALASILAMEPSALEVVVVDNAPATTLTRRVVEELDDSRLRYVLEPVPGLSRARNRGVAEAVGEVVAFTDDDVVVDAGWLGALKCGFGRSERVACVTGLIVPSQLDTPAQVYFEAMVKWSASLTPRKFDLEEHRPCDPLFPYRAGEFGAGANFAARRAAVVELKGFDEALGAGSRTGGGEDLDFFVRVILAKYALACEPCALVWHAHRSEIHALLHQMSSYRAGLAAYTFKHMLTRNGVRVAASAVLGRPRRPATVSAPRPLVPHIRGMLRAELTGLVIGPPAYVWGRLSRRRTASHL